MKNRKKITTPVVATRHTPACSQAASATVETLESRRMLAANFDLGINVNEGSQDTRNKGIPVMKQLGVESVRIWISPTFSNRYWDGPLKRAVEYAAAGFDVMLIVSTPDGKVTNPNEVKGWFEWAAGNSSLRNAVDRWQIGNEVDQDAYWRGSLSSYVNNFLKPASQVLKSKGEKVVSGSVSWNPKDVEEMIGDGMLNYVDYVGYHPYADSIAQLKSRVSQIKSIVNGRKPLVASEWNVRKLENNKTAWAAAVKQAFPIIRDNFAMNYYFALLNTSRGKAGPGGIMNSNGTKQTGFYNALAAGMNGGGGSGTVDTGTDNGSGNSGGNVSSSIPSVAKVSVYNSDTGEKIFDSLTSGSTIDLSKYDTNKLKFNATLGSGTASVKLTFDGQSRTENHAPFDWTNLAVKAGSYTLTATPYAANYLSGQKGSTRTYSFKVINSPGSSNSGNTGSTGNTGNTGSTNGKGSISGRLFSDTDADGNLDSNEGFTAVRTVFIDANRNGRQDKGEATTSSDSKGNFKFSNLSAGTYAVSRVLPKGYRFTTTSTSYLDVTVGNGRVVTGANLGSTSQQGSSGSSSSSNGGNSGNSTASGTGTITGRLWSDTNRNGKIDSGEGWKGSRTVFLDSNRNGKLDKGERSTSTDYNGNYSFSNVAVGTSFISRELPSGYSFTNTSNAYITATVLAGKTTSGVNLGSKGR